MVDPCHDSPQTGVNGALEERITRFRVSDFKFERANTDRSAAPSEPRGEVVQSDRWAHCPQCGTPERDQAVMMGGPAIRCSNCGAVLRASHRIVVVGIGLYDGAVLLVKRAIEPRCGFWSLPGGYVESGELMEEAIAREFSEEANVRIRRPRLIACYEMPQLNQLFGVYVASLGRGSISLATRSQRLACSRSGVCLLMS